MGTYFVEITVVGFDPREFGACKLSLYTAINHLKEFHDLSYIAAQEIDHQSERDSRDVEVDATSKL